MSTAETMNPFKAGVHSGVQTYHCVAEDRIRAAAWFDRAQCDAALKLPGLQKTVAAAVQRRLRYLDQVVLRVHFEDHGQDFLRWEINAKGKVIGCEPFQAAHWCGLEVWQPALLRAGDLLHFLDREDDSMRHIKYRLARVEHLKGGAA